MENNNKNPKLKKAANIFRLILAVVFIFSGVMKTLDPWGTAVMITEYFKVFHLEWFSSWSVGLAVWVCAGELMMGLMLLFRVRTRLISIFSVLTMTGFTILTFIVAAFDPLDSCGCFGDAIKIDNWHSFFKNLILWPMSFTLWWSLRGEKIFSFSRREVTLVFVFMFVAVGTAIYSWRNLPFVEFYDYGKGTNLRTDVRCSRCADRNMRLVYRDLTTGQEHDFALTDTTWYDDTRWEYVRTASNYDANPPAVTEYDFALWHGGLNEADEVIYAEGRTHLIVVRELTGRRPAGCFKHLLPYLDKLAAAGANVVVVTAMDPEGMDDVPTEADLDGRVLKCYGMERALLKLLLRADVGEVVVDDGVITGKRSCWNLK